MGSETSTRLWAFIYNKKIHAGISSYYFPDVVLVLYFHDSKQLFMTDSAFLLHSSETINDFQDSQASFLDICVWL